MNWKNRIENIKFSITTGDGKKYEPLWKNSQRERDYNFAKFDFINVTDSLIDRKKAQSHAYTIEMFFTGDDYLENSNAFEKSTENENITKINHPIYGEIKGFITKLKRDDISFGRTKFEIDFFESIEAEFPDSSESIQDRVSSRVEKLNSDAIINYLSNANPSTDDIQTLKASINETSGNFKSDANNFNDYKRIVDTALKESNNLISKTSASITSAQSVLSFPARFDRKINDKINSVKRAYKKIKELSNFEKKQDKVYFENQSASLLGNFAESAVNPKDDDYILRSDIEFVNNEMLSLYNDYLEQIDQNQVSIQDVDNFYIPNIEVQQGLNDLITFTSQALFVLTFDARQERIYITENETNLIVLTHQLIGLDVEDKNVKKLKQINRIGLNEIYRIKKGREIKYFV